MRRLATLPPVTRLVLILAIVVIAIIIIAGFVLGMNPGPAQPIPFSHRIHAGTKDLSCFFCHPGASRGLNAGLPSVEKCILCHKVIASQFKPIADLRRYYDRRQPIPWIRIAFLPDFVHFNHECHIAGGHDCGDCHGDVKGMDRIKLVHEFKMGFCIDCHTKNGVSVNCFLCHY